MRCLFLPIFSLLLLYASIGYSQEMLGIINSNYSGTSGILNNPSAIANSPFRFELNFITLDLFLENNNVYTPNNHFFSIKKHIEESDELLAYNNANIAEKGLTSNFLLKDDLTSFSKSKCVYFNIHILGPSFMFRYKKHSFAFHTAIRTNLSITGVHSSIAKYAFEGLPYRDQHFKEYTAPKFRVNTLAWSEYGLSYGVISMENREYRTKVGVTAKYLIGYAGLYFNNRVIQYVIEEQNPVQFNRLDAALYKVDLSYGYVNPDSYEDGLSKGKGVGFSIGGALEKVSDDGVYKWHLGASLIDIGSINFKNDANSFDLKNDQKKWIRVDSVTVSGVTDLDSTFSDQIYNNYAASASENSFKMGLPTAISLQGNYMIQKNIFVNMTIVQRIPKRNPGIDRGNIVAVTPRYEIKWLELAMPFVLYDYTRPRIGLAARLGYFTIGSDKVSSLFIKSKFSGLDIYTSIRFFLDKDKKQKGYKGKHGPNHKGAIPCFQF